eukprot:12327-Heterococcus_DN1.PRE.5
MDVDSSIVAAVRPAATSSISADAPEYKPLSQMTSAVDTTAAATSSDGGDVTAAAAAVDTGSPAATSAATAASSDVAESDATSDSVRYTATVAAISISCSSNGSSSHVHFSVNVWLQYYYNTTCMTLHYTHSESIKERGREQHGIHAVDTVTSTLIVVKFCAHSSSSCMPCQLHSFEDVNTHTHREETDRHTQHLPALYKLLRIRTLALSDVTCQEQRVDNTAYVAVYEGAAEGIWRVTYGGGACNAAVDQLLSVRRTQHLALLPRLLLLLLHFVVAV